MTRDQEIELRCAYDLRAIPVRRAKRHEAYCSERCKRATQNWRRREQRKAVRS